jgi:hypothetical protein
MSFLGGNKYRDSWVQVREYSSSLFISFISQRASNSNGFRSSSIANTSQIQSEERKFDHDEKGTQQLSGSMAFQRPKNDIPRLSQSQEKSHQPMVPKFVETDKQVLRFLCHITEMERGSKRPIPINIRFFSLLIYLEDNTFEIIEDRIPNSGLRSLCLASLVTTLLIRNWRRNILSPKCSQEE